MPLAVVISREVQGDGREDLWMLLDTQPLGVPSAAGARPDEYHLRTTIEEGHRQLKCCWDLTHFTSRAFALVVNHGVFGALAYTLLQLSLRQQGRAELTRRTRPRVRAHLLPSAAVILISCQQRFATLTPLEYTELLLTLAEPARGKILAQARRLRRELLDALPNPRPPERAAPPQHRLFLRIPATGRRAGGHPGQSPFVSPRPRGIPSADCAGLVHGENRPRRPPRLRSIRPSRHVAAGLSESQRRRVWLDTEEGRKIAYPTALPRHRSVPALHVRARPRRPVPSPTNQSAEMPGNLR